MWRQRVSSLAISLNVLSASLNKTFPSFLIFFAHIIVSSVRITSPLVHFSPVLPCTISTQHILFAVIWRQTYG